MCGYGHHFDDDLLADEDADEDEGNGYGELKDPHAFVGSCNDDFRPVSFLLNVTEEDVPVFL